MERIDKSILSMVIFLAVVLFIAIFGFFAIKNNPHRQAKKEPKIEVNDYQAIKVKPDEEFIIYRNPQVISEELEIYYQELEININHSLATSVASELNAQTQAYASKVAYISQTKVPANTVLTNIDDIYYAPVREYHSYLNQHYLILNVHDYEYYATGINNPTKDQYFIFDLNDGSLVTAEQLLNIYGITRTTLIRRLNTYLQEKANLNPDLIKLNETVAQFSNPDNIKLYIAADGHLMANILVITNEINYNDNIIVE